jgi:hypothetical protein
MENFSILERNLGDNGEVSFGSFNWSCQPDKFTGQFVSRSSDINPITWVKFLSWRGTTVGSLMALLPSAFSVGSTPILISFKYDPFRGAIILSVTASYGGAVCEIRAINYATAG